MRPITTYAQPTRRRAADIIQGAHDAIERYGFNIGHYGDYSQEDLLDIGDAVVEPMCYVGNLAFAAGMDPSNIKVETRLQDLDGPEFVLALETLDELANEVLVEVDEEVLRSADQRFFNFLQYGHTEAEATGRFIERLGFVVRVLANTEFPIPTMPEGTVTSPIWDQWHLANDAMKKRREAYERDYALGILRKALTKLYKEGQLS